MNSTMQTQIKMRLTIKKIQLGSARISLLDELVSLRDKLGWAIKHLEEGRENVLVSSNLGRDVTEIVRKQEVIEGAVREIQTLDDMLEESKVA